MTDLREIDGQVNSSVSQPMTLLEMQKKIHETAINHGWWERDRNDGEVIALMHSELSEALEWMRKGDKSGKGKLSALSDHIPEFTGVEEELADVIIRILDYAQANYLDIEGAIHAKMEFNDGRPYKHGGKRF